MVGQGEVVEAVLPLLVHGADAVAHDERDLVGEGRVIALQVGDGAGHQLGVAVLVLHPLAVQGGAPGSAAEQEALAHHVPAGPDHVPHPLEAEYGVEDVEGDHRQAVVGVSGAGGQEGGHGAGLADAFLQDLAVLGLLVGGDAAGVHRLVALALRGVDAGLGEQAVHAEGARLVRDDGHDVAAQVRIPEQTGQHAHHHHGGGRLPLRTLEHVRKQGQGRRLQLGALHPSVGDGAAKGGAPFLEVADFRSVLRRAVEVRGQHRLV